MAPAWAPPMEALLRHLGKEEEEGILRGEPPESAGCSHLCLGQVGWAGF